MSFVEELEKKSRIQVVSVRDRTHETNTSTHHMRATAQPKSTSEGCAVENPPPPAIQGEVDERRDRGAISLTFDFFYYYI